MWDRSWGSGDGDTDVAAGIAVDDGEGLVYVVGSTQGSFGVAVGAPNGTVRAIEESAAASRDVCLYTTSK